MEEQTIGMFCGQVQFLFFPNRHMLKFLEMKCNPTNKNYGIIHTNLVKIERHLKYTGEEPQNNCMNDLEGSQFAHNLHEVSMH